MTSPDRLPVAVDAMGGDKAPAEIVAGAIRILSADSPLRNLGRRKRVLLRLAVLGAVKAVNTTENFTKFRTVERFNLDQLVCHLVQHVHVVAQDRQRALMRLSQAETQGLAMSTSLLRVHDELSKIVRETLGGDDGSDTIINTTAITKPSPAFAGA